MKELSPGKKETGSGDETPAPYKAVLIVGKDHSIPEDIMQQFLKEGYLLIGDGNERLTPESCSVLKGRLDKDSRIYVWAHGTAKNGVHKIGMLTKDFFKVLASYNEGIPLNIQLNSCFAGAAAPDVSELPNGSVLVAHGASDYRTLVSVNSKVILQSSQDLRSTDLVHDFIHKFALNVKQTATISLKKSNGSIFQHTVRPPNGTLTIPSEVVRYLESERARFIAAYNQECTPIIEPDKLPAITEKEAIEWRNDNFLYSINIGDERLLEALITKINSFDDYINHSLIGSGLTALPLAAQKGYEKIVSALIVSDKINASEVNKALTLAVQKGYEKVVSALLISDKIDANEINKALVSALVNGFDKVVTALLASDKINVNLRDKDGLTPLILAVKLGKIEVVKAMLLSPKIDEATLIIKDNLRNTALMWAIKQNNKAMVDAMLASGKINASTDLPNNTGRTALMQALELGRDDIALALIEAKVGINTQDKERTSPLMLAVGQNKTKVIEALITAGADKTLRDKEGFTAFDIATQSGLQDLASQLVPRMSVAQVNKPPEKHTEKLSKKPNVRIPVPTKHSSFVDALSPKTDSATKHVTKLAAEAQLANKHDQSLTH